jgi:hypothetical protein
LKRRQWRRGSGSASISRRDTGALGEGEEQGGWCGRRWWRVGSLLNYDLTICLSPQPSPARSSFLRRILRDLSSEIVRASVMHNVRTALHGLPEPGARCFPGPGPPPRTLGEKPSRRRGQARSSRLRASESACSPARRLRRVAGGHTGQTERNKQHATSRASCNTTCSPAGRRTGDLHVQGAKGDPQPLRAFLGEVGRAGASIAEPGIARPRKGAPRCSDSGQCGGRREGYKCTHTDGLHLLPLSSTYQLT